MVGHHLVINLSAKQICKMWFLRIFCCKNNKCMPKKLQTSENLDLMKLYKKGVEQIMKDFSISKVVKTTKHFRMMRQQIFTELFEFQI